MIIMIVATADKVTAALADPTASDMKIEDLELEQWELIIVIMIKIKTKMTKMVTMKTKMTHKVM